MTRDIMNDLSFCDMLVSPGYEVEFAIGTTYSLSLEALLSVPISLGMLGEIDDTSRNYPLCLLKAIRDSSNRFALFVNRGSIAVPMDVRRVYSLLEESIFEVYDTKNAYANFHPKVWIIKECNQQDENDCQIKVLVMSRNLTFDNSLDVAASLTAKIKSQPTDYAEKHQPLKQWLEWLSTFASTERRHKIRELINDIDCLDWFDVDAPFCDYDFYPIIYGEKDEKLMRQMQGSSMAIISPFIDIETIRSLNGRAANHSKTLITRKEYVDKEIFDEYQGEADGIYVVNDAMLNGEYGSINLHAKMYVVGCPLHESSISLFLGSANATDSGFNRNTEFLLRLRFKRGQYVMTNFVNEIINDTDRCFEPLLSPTVDKIDNEPYSMLERSIKHLLAAGISGKITVCDEHSASIQICCKIPSDGIRYKIAPLQALGKEVELCSVTKIEDIGIEQLSELYKLTATDGHDTKSIIVKIRTRGIPIDDRNQLIVQSIVDTKEKFLSYVELILSDSPEMFQQSIWYDANGKSAGKNAEATYPSLYEDLLRAAYKSPQKLEQVNRFVEEMTSSGKVDKDFLKMYNKFTDIVKQL